MSSSGALWFCRSAGTDDERIDFIEEVHKRGCLNWDTAEGYADSEELIGKWIAKSGKRNDVGVPLAFSKDLARLFG